MTFEEVPLVSLARVSARAQGVPTEIAELKAQVAALQSQVKTLQTQLAAVQSNKALELGPFVSVNPNPENGVIGPNITFKGANIHIVSGSGVTDDHLSTGGSLTGLGNLIIGYDEHPTAIGLPFNPGDRGGSHNLVILRWHRFSTSFGGSFGGLVAGEANAIYFEADSVSGGEYNFAGGRYSSVSGGSHNSASVDAASVNGGLNNIASGGIATVCGGGGNTAAGFEAVVIGGSNIIANNSNSIAPGAPLNYPLF